METKRNVEGYDAVNADEYSALEMDYEKERKAVYNFECR